MAKFKKKLDERDLKLLYELSALRMPTDQIAALLGMSKDTLERQVKANDAVRAAMVEGRAKSSHRARRTLYDRAMGRPERRAKDPVTGQEIVEKALESEPWALKFWCETQEGFKRADRLEITGAGGEPIEVVKMTDKERREALKEQLRRVKMSDECEE